MVDYEVHPNNKWNVGPCSSDGKLKRAETGRIIMSPGLHVATGPHCMIKQFGGKRGGMCLDIIREHIDPGQGLQVHPCRQRWNQAFAFGNGNVTPVSSIHASVPIHLQKVNRTNKEQTHHLCIGVYTADDWKSTVEEGKKSYVEYNSNVSDKVLNSLSPINLMDGKEIITLPCSEPEDVLEFAFVPFITEDDDHQQS